MSQSTDLAKAAEDFVDQLSGDIIIDPEIFEKDEANNLENRDTPKNGLEATQAQDDSDSEDKKNGLEVNDGIDAKNVETNEKSAEELNGNVNKLESENKIQSDSSYKILNGKTFFINKGADAHDSVNDIEKLEKLITDNGGKLVEHLPGEDEDQSEEIIVVSPYNDTKLPTVTPTYIRECINGGSLLDMKNYLVPYDEFRAVIDNNLQVPFDPETHENINGPMPSTLPPDTAHELDTVDDSAKNDNGNGDEEDDEDGNMYHDAVDNSEILSQPLAQLPQSTEDNNQHIVNVTNNNDNGGVHNRNNQNVADDSNSFMNSYDTSMSRDNLPNTNKISFTTDEDAFILDVVRKNPTRRTTHTLFDEISHYVPNHTGNSIRHRYRKYLAKKLDFVYKVDDFGKLLRDDDGNLIQTKELPTALKRRFTALEDYNLAKAIKRQFYIDLYQINPDTGESLIGDNDPPNVVAKRKVTMDRNHVRGSEPAFANFTTDGRKGPVSREFFKTFADKYQTHSQSAWRDRLRKFVLVYGVDSYIQYYEAEKAEGREPEPIKNMTNRPKREGQPVPGNYNSTVKRLKTNAVERNRQISILQGGVQLPTTPQKVNGSAGAGLQTVNNVNRNYAIPESELLDEETMNFISDLKNDLKNIGSNLPFEYPQEIADAIRHDFSVEEAEYDEIDPDTIPFPPSIATRELFQPKFYQMANTKEFMDKIEEVISRDYEPSQAEKLVQDLCDEAGVRKVFSTSILTALSGDLMVFPRYFLNAFKGDVNPPPNVPGIWTREDDAMLKRGDVEDINLLKKKHGTGRIEMRKKFIEKDLV
ncbi:DNA-binding transcription factor rap1 [Maudiozyma exigua]|uniref:DNA-binding protein RAP1 n=1 Tax=Maudiozyma exigua TaxID=34358 RepID=A0A9P7BCA9_MAUEX|nr:DNA-binding transcription factor rap1 [Kazachstania exigua]